jgi:ankyrin repeat protein
MSPTEKPYWAPMRKVVSAATALRPDMELDRGVLALALWMVDPLEVEGEIWAHIVMEPNECGVDTMRCVQFDYAQNRHSEYWNCHGHFKYSQDALDKNQFYDHDDDYQFQIDPRNMALFIKHMGLAPIDRSLLETLVEVVPVMRSNAREVLATLDAHAGVQANLSAAPFDSSDFLINALDGAVNPEFRELVIQSALESMTPMRAAVSNDRVDLVHEFMSRGFPVDALDREVGHTSSKLIHFAGSSESVTKFLLDCGACPFSKDAAGATPLHRAAHPDVARLLIAQGALVNEEDVDGNVVLHYAIRHAVSGKVVDPRVLDVLLEAGADPFYRPEDAYRSYLSPFETAVKEGFVHHVRRITELCNVDFGLRSLHGRTLIQLAGANEEMKRLLRAAKAEASIRTSAKVVGESGAGENMPRIGAGLTNAL